MTDQIRPRGLDLAAVLAALPTGVAVYDAHRRIAFLNPAFEQIIGLPAGLLQPGNLMAEVTRLVAHRGLFGPGDPDALAAEMMQGDDRRPRQYTRRRADGGTFESQYIPLASGFAVSVTDTTQLTALREHAEQASGRVNQAMPQLQVGLAVFGPDRRLGLHNARFLELLGLKDSPPNAIPILAGTPFADVVRAAGQTHAFDQPGAVEFLTLQRAQDRSRETRTTWRRPDGIVVALQSDPLGTGGWAMTLIDITAQATAENEVRHRAALLEAIIAHLPSGVVVYGADERVTLVNEAYRAVMHGAAGYVGERDGDLVLRQAQNGEFGPGDPAALARERTAVLDRSATGVHRRRRPTGQIVEVRMAPLPDGGVVRVITDVSHEVAAEAERSRHAERMAEMLSHIRHGIVLWDRGQRIVAANTVLTDLLGAEPGLFVPGITLEKTITAALARGNFGHEEGAARLANTLRDKDRSRSHVDQRLTCDGRVLEVRSDPTPDGGFVTTYTDVTLLRQTEDALKEAKAAAEQANLAKSSFLAAMSQELRRPLAQMMEQAELIRRELAGRSQGTEPALTAAARMVQAGQAMLDRLSNILDVARLEAGRFGLADDTVPAGVLIGEALTTADAAAAAAEVTLTACLPDREPMIRGDRRRLLNALDHLIRHALTLTRPGEIVTLAVTVGPGGMAVTVTTPGTVLDAAALGRAFNPFSPNDGPTGQQPVLRLGLYTSRAIMEAHGGTVTLRSAPGLGTAAVMHLPAGRVLIRAPTTPH